MIPAIPNKGNIFVFTIILAQFDFQSPLLKYLQRNRKVSVKARIDDSSR